MGSTFPFHPCGSCEVYYDDFSLLQEHLYWKHGTNSYQCNNCGLRRWEFAEHRCHFLPVIILPMDYDDSEGEGSKVRQLNSVLPDTSDRKGAFTHTSQFQSVFSEEKSQLTPVDLGLSQVLSTSLAPIDLTCTQMQQLPILKTKSNNIPLSTSQPLVRSMPVVPLESYRKLDEVKIESQYCYCRRFIVDSKMIGCDGPECRVQWYHFTCVGMETAPDGDWLCPECSRGRDIKKGLNNDSRSNNQPRSQV